MGKLYDVGALKKALRQWDWRLMLDRAEMDRKMDEHFGFEARDDVAGVLSTLASDVTHDIVGWPTGPT